MNRVPTWLVALLIAIGMTAGAASVARADDFNCTGTIGAQSLDNIIVPNGASCTLNGTQAGGNIIVGTGSTLLANNVKVDGNIQAEGATSVTVNNNATVGGSIQIKQGSAASVVNVTVTGDIQFETNNGAILADGNTVGGNLQAFTNSGGLTIQNNVIDGNLQCKENNPAPTGGNNQAASLEDQCAALGGPVTPPTNPPVTSGQCTGSVGAQRFENLSVPNGASCTLNGTQVDGNIIVGTGSNLQAVNIVVGGNVQAEGATTVAVTGDSRVGGSIQIKQGQAVAIADVNAGAITVAGVRVTGDIQFEANSSPIVADNNIIGGNLQAFGNSGGVTVRSNSMNGNLQCNANTPEPQGGNNLATSLEDQCEPLSMSNTSQNFTRRDFIPAIP